MSRLINFCFVMLLCVKFSSGAAHNHNFDNQERESDGSYRSRDADHYSEAGHNSEFDHEAILGSVREADEYDKLSPEESKQRLSKLLPNMDLNGDSKIDRSELKKWIMNSFIKLSREEAEERMSDVDEDKDGMVTWQEYLQDTFGSVDENDIGPDDVGETGMYLNDEKELWSVADNNKDGKLNIDEFAVFISPEEHPVMHPHLISHTMRDKDKNRDGRIDFKEYIEDRAEQNKEMYLSEKDKFDNELDLNSDGILDAEEVARWVIPDNEEIADEEVDHLFASADDNNDQRLSFDEILEHHDVFVGSEATDYGNDLLGHHFDDEL